MNLYAKDEPIYQVSTIDALLEGSYDGRISVNDFLKHGDIGIGTFDVLDGEMIVLDGKCFKAQANGEVIQVQNNETVPFGVITNFELENQHHIEEAMNLVDLENYIDSIVVNKNVFYVMKIVADFQYVKYRSEPKQNKPYKKLKEVIEKEQVVFESKNISGTIIGFYCPAYTKGINVAGYHFHFLSDDKSKGGHVLDFKADNLLLIMDQKTELFLSLGDEKLMRGLDLTTHKKDDLAVVEGLRGTR
jgi:acetolactate decarboxylase